jgi:hypothetical protein
MNEYLVIFREPDGRSVRQSEEEIRNHQQHWKQWFVKMKSNGNLLGGKPLTLNSRIMHPANGTKPGVSNGIHKVNGQEIIGGYLLIRASDLDAAVSLMNSCPVFDFGGVAEIRETMEIQM